MMERGEVIEGGEVMERYGGDGKREVMERGRGEVVERGR